MTFWLPPWLKGRVGLRYDALGTTCGLAFVKAFALWRTTRLTFWGRDVASVMADVMVHLMACFVAVVCCLC